MMTGPPLTHNFGSRGGDGWGMDGWDGMGSDLRVGGGIEHLTVLIKPV